MADDDSMGAYADKMLTLAEDGVDLAVDARFVNSLIGPGSFVLDVGCGIGSAVVVLRELGHQAFGFDPILLSGNVPAILGTPAIADAFAASRRFSRPAPRRLPIGKSAPG